MRRRPDAALALRARAAAFVLIAAAAGAARAEEPAPPSPVPAPAPSPTPAPPAGPPPCAASRQAAFAIDGAIAREVVPLVRALLAADDATWAASRASLEAWMNRAAQSGRVDLLRDVETLGKVLHRARPYDAPIAPKSFERGARWHRDEANRIASVSGRLLPREDEAEGGELRASLMLPAGYPADARRLADTPPYPTLLVLHDRADRDEGGKVAPHPGAVAIRRRWLKDPALRAAAQEWLLFAPVAGRPTFAEDIGEEVARPLGQLWRRHAVDVDRTVVDGADDAFTVAVARPHLLAGLVLRGGTVDPSLVRNLAGMPVYVVGSADAPAAAALRAGGLEPRVGPAEGLADWLREACATPRRPPRSFRWKVGDPRRDRLAHWIVLRAPQAGAELTVAVDAAANRVRIDATGVGALVLCLNDRIVDLRRPVEVVVNGTVARAAAPVVPSFDTLFGVKSDPSLLESRYYGWLYPVVLDPIEVPAAGPPPPASVAPPGR